MATDEALQVTPRKRRVGKVGGDVTCCSPTPIATLQVQETVTLTKVLRALADPTRLQIVTLLAQHAGEVCVCDITRTCELDQSTISHHLRLLREAGIIDVARHGVWAYYFMRESALQPVEQLLEQLRAVRS